MLTSGQVALQWHDVHDRLYTADDQHAVNVWNMGQPSIGVIVRAIAHLYCSQRRWIARSTTFRGSTISRFSTCCS